MGIEKPRLKKIYHISDVHWRNLNRHVEYREVFEKVFAEIRKRGVENSIIYLAGDIVHAKLDLSPEIIREVSWLFTECARLCPTILIAGNHDCNMNNMSRLDALTPIVDALNLPNFHYLRDTQVFAMGGVDFAVFSIFDKRNNWPKPSEMFGNKKIALFHGPIDSSVTDVGYVVSSRHFKPEIFDGFDAALCGDIHRRQIIVSDTGCKIAYPSSVVQQNFGESLEGHGFMVWDLDTWECEAVDIQNDYGYYTMHVVNGVVPDVLDIPKYPRLRVRLSNTNASDTKRIITEIKMKYKVNDFTIVRTDSFSKMRLGNRASKLEFDDITDVAYQNALISEQVQNIMPSATKSDFIGLETINADINSRISVDDIHRNINWKPIRFEFENMFSYGEGNVINFDKITGLMGLFAPNAQGKSSIFSSVAFCIFDKCDRTFRASSILNSRATSFWCELGAEINGTEYHIRREAKTVNKGKNVKVDVQFWKIEGGQSVSLNGTERRDTDAIIEQYFGRYEDFLLTALSVQGNNALFIDKSQTERKDLLAQFMGLTIFDKLYETASEDVREVTTLIKNFKRTDFTTELAEKQIELKKKKQQFGELDLKIKENEKISEGWNCDIIELSKNITPIDTNLDIDELVKKKKGIQSELTILTETKWTKTERLTDIKRKVFEAGELIDTKSKLNGIDIFVAKQQWDSYTDQIVDIAHKTELLAQSISSNLVKLSHLEKHEYDPNCKFCMNNVFVTDALATKATVKEQYVELEKLRLESRRLVDTASPLNTANLQWIEWSEYTETKKRLIITRDKLQAELKNCDTKEELLTHQLKSVGSDIARYNDNEEFIITNKGLNKQISILTQSKRELEIELAEMKRQLLRTTAETGSIKTFIDTTKQKMKEVKELETKNELYTLYLEAVKRDGIPYDLISKALPVIEDEINNILSQVVDFHIVMDTDGKNINAKIVYDDNEWALEMCSGMEKFISGLAIRVALINICNLPRPNFLVIDEGMGTLDSENLASLYMMFSYLKNQFDFIILISHLDSIRDVVDGFLEIKKIDGFSNIKF